MEIEPAEKSKAEESSSRKDNEEKSQKMSLQPACSGEWGYSLNKASDLVFLPLGVKAMGFNLERQYLVYQGQTRLKSA